MDALQRYYRINKDGIALFKFILESYDNAAVMRTVDERNSIIELLVSPGFDCEVQAVIEELRQELAIEEIMRPDDLDPL